jgi:DNA-binding transcriptional LysR family regulator
VRIAELADTPLIPYPKHQNAQFKRTVQSLYRDAGVTPFVAHQAYEIQTAIALVAAGLGVTFVGESVARDDERTSCSVISRARAPRNGRRSPQRIARTMIRLICELFLALGRRYLRYTEVGGYLSIVGSARRV